MVLVEPASLVHHSPLWVWLMRLIFSARNSGLEGGLQSLQVPSSDLHPQDPLLQWDVDDVHLGSASYTGTLLKP